MQRPLLGRGDPIPASDRSSPLLRSEEPGVYWPPLRPPACVLGEESGRPCPAGSRGPGPAVPREGPEKASRIGPGFGGGIPPDRRALDGAASPNTDSLGSPLHSPDGPGGSGRIGDRWPSVAPDTTRLADG